MRATAAAVREFADADADCHSADTALALAIIASTLDDTAGYWPWTYSPLIDEAKRLLHRTLNDYSMHSPADATGRICGPCPPADQPGR